MDPNSLSKKTLLGAFLGGGGAKVMMTPLPELWGGVGGMPGLPPGSASVLWSVDVYAVMWCVRRRWEGFIVEWDRGVYSVGGIAAPPTQLELKYPNFGKKCTEFEENHASMRILMVRLALFTVLSTPSTPPSTPNLFDEATPLPWGELCCAGRFGSAAVLQRTPVRPSLFQLALSAGRPPWLQPLGPRLQPPTTNDRPARRRVTSPPTNHAAGAGPNDVTRLATHCAKMYRKNEDGRPRRWGGVEAPFGVLRWTCLDRRSTSIQVSGPAPGRGTLGRRHGHLSAARGGHTKIPGRQWVPCSAGTSSAVGREHVPGPAERLIRVDSSFIVFSRGADNAFLCVASHILPTSAVVWWQKWPVLEAWRALIRCIWVAGPCCRRRWTRGRPAAGSADNRPSLPTTAHFKVTQSQLISPPCLPGGRPKIHTEPKSELCALALAPYESIVGRREHCLHSWQQLLKNVTVIWHAWRGFQPVVVSHILATLCAYCR